MFYNDGVKIISLVTIILGRLVMSIKILFKSKCKTVNIYYGLLNTIGLLKSKQK